MAWRPDRLFQAAEIDNTTLGWTIGWVEIEGIENRLQLKLAGNCNPDLAGWKFRIHRIEPDPPETEPLPDCHNLSHDQSGHVGDITADQMIKHHEISTSELVSRLSAGEETPFTWRKCVYLEWYGNQNGRVVIQSTRLEVERLGERAFELTNEQWLEQSKQNADELGHFMAQLGDALQDGENEREPNSDE